MFYAEKDGNRVRPSPRADACCPLCGEAVRAKCGQIVDWYWSHRTGTDCDPWAEPETAWHLWWKERARLEQREVSRAGHRADIVTDAGMVVELQHSPISVADIEAREAAYGNMIWLIDARTFEFGTLEFGYPVRRLERLSESYWRWRRARPSLRVARRPIYFDLGSTILRPDLGRAIGYRTLEFRGEVKSRDFFLDRLGLQRASDGMRKYISVLGRIERSDKQEGVCTTQRGRNSFREFRSMRDIEELVRRRGGCLTAAYGWCSDETIETFDVSPAGVVD